MSDIKDFIVAKVQNQRYSKSAVKTLTIRVPVPQSDLADQICAMLDVNRQELLSTIIRNGLKDAAVTLSQVGSRGESREELQRLIKAAFGAPQGS